jgi:hypothetical protein
MRAIEFVIETKKAKVPKEQIATWSNTSTLPNHNMYHGSGYLHSQFIKALAGAGAGDTPDADMGKENFAGGDPIVTPYHPIEEEMIDRANKAIGDNNRKKWGTRDSREPEDTHKVSPHKPFKGYKRK